MAPAEVVVVAERRERRSRESRAGHIPSAVAVDVTLDPLAGPEERLMRIDEEHRLSRRALRRADRPRVRPDLAGAPRFFRFVIGRDARRFWQVARHAIRLDLLNGGANFGVADSGLAIYEK